MPRHANVPGDADEQRVSDWNLNISSESFDTHYEGFIEIDLADSFTIAYLRERPSRIVLARTLSNPKLDEKLYNLQNLRHPTFLSTLHIFVKSSEYIVVSEYMEVSLYEILRSPARPSESQVIWIVKQILEGLAHLHGLGWAHGNLVAHRILLRRDGAVRLSKWPAPYAFMLILHSGN